MINKILDQKILMQHEKDKLLKFLEDESLLDSLEKSCEEYLEKWEMFLKDDRISDLENPQAFKDDWIRAGVIDTERFNQTLAIRQGFKELFNQQIQGRE